VAKVMISIPDDLLERVDAQASAAGETRSGFLQRLAEEEIAARGAERQRRIEGLLEMATTSLGGDAAQLVREDRESH
jgi:metal-responsive CopG/Arc/MetJ family transcriptional regulator